MKKLTQVVLLLVVAAFAGYWGGRHSSSDAPQAPPVQPPAVSSNGVAPPAAPPQAAAPTVSTIISYRGAVERAAPSVVTVHSARTVARGPLGLGGRQLLSQGLGSGVLLDTDGHIVTNNHVVQDATELAIALPDGTLRETRLLGVDPDTDLALLKIDGKGLQPITMGNNKDLAVGDVVLAVGNPLGVGQTVTQGIVSAVGRKGIGINPIENFIQTDAAINPGNSGGALIDSAGRLVGINSAILSRGGGSEGIGFAIPIDLAQKVVASLQKNGRVARGWLGVSTAAAPPGHRGAMIVAVQRGGPADHASMAPGDIIVRLGERPIEQPGDLVGTTLELEPGARVPVELIRGDKRLTLQVELGRRPPLRRLPLPGE
jgi:serine protease DegQ